MKRFLLGLIVGFLVLSQGPVWADSPIYQGFLWESSPAAAYNTQRGGYLVVWNVYNPLFPPSDVRFFGPVLGQLITEDGQLIGAPIEIFNAGVLPKVAYNAQAKEYLVVSEQSFNTVGQRVSALGVKIGGPVILLTEARFPRVLYNSLAGTYLVTGGWLTGSENCSLRLTTRKVSAGGQPLGSPVVVADEPHGACADGDRYGARYALDYAPIVSQKTPQGRYLLAIENPNKLKMLDSEGRSLLTRYNPNEDIWEYWIPFEQSKVGDPFHIDVAYGIDFQGNRSFLLVWGDISQTVSGQAWSGIWAGLVDAQKELYLTTEPVSNTVFPISYQYDHWPYYKEWRPVAKYNAPADKFVVAWRETPKTDPRDLTNVNHIRVNTIERISPPEDNLVVSATTGTENPVLPFLASSTRSSKLLIAWEDYRNFLGDIYGTMFDSATRSLSGITPGGSTPPCLEPGFGGSEITVWENGATGACGPGG